MWKILLAVVIVAVLAGCKTPSTGDDLTTLDGSAFDLGAVDPAIIPATDLAAERWSGDLGLPVAGGAMFVDPNDPSLAALDPQLAADAQAVLRDVHFAYDSSEILPNEAAILQQVAGFVSRYPSVLLQIGGHCDERGTEEYNMALGSRRASAVRSFLADLQINPNRLYTISFGEEQPADPGNSETAWARNRRAHFKIGLTGR